MNKLKVFWLIVIFFILTGCEERGILNTPFPHQSEKLFCELIGFVGVGFIGKIEKVQKVQENSVPVDIIYIKIWEDDQIIFHENYNTGDININYNIDANRAYRIEIEYDGKIIQSNAEKVGLPYIHINNISVENNYVDSLGINVVTASFDFTSPNIIDTIYYITSFELSDLFLEPFSISSFSLPKLLPDSEVVFINKRIPNLGNDHFLRSNIFTINRSFFQYLKNINQLNQLPNDNIDGHHGNLEGGIGYFGIVNFDTKFTSF